MGTPSERLLVWGAGGHGKVVADLVRASGHALAGFADRDPAKLGREAEPGRARVITTEAELLQRVENGVELPSSATAVVPAVGANANRLSFIAAVGERLAAPLLHPTAAISPTVTIAAGTVVFAGAVINAAARIGRGVIVNSAAIVEHDCVLDDGTHVAPGAVLAGGVRLGTRSLIGAGAVVLEGRVIGADAVVGAGAIVIRDVPQGCTVVGNPARRLK